MGRNIAVWVIFWPKSPESLATYEKGLESFISENCLANFWVTFDRRWATFDSNLLVTLNSPALRSFQPMSI